MIIKRNDFDFIVSFHVFNWHEKEIIKTVVKYCYSCFAIIRPSSAGIVSDGITTSTKNKNNAYRRKIVRGSRRETAYDEFFHYCFASYKQKYGRFFSCYFFFFYPDDDYAITKYTPHTDQHYKRT